MEADKRKITSEMISDLVNKLGSNDGFVREHARLTDRFRERSGAFFNPGTGIQTATNPLGGSKGIS